jgi:hypothetical protein
MTIILYRAVCDAEFDHALATRRLSVIGGSLEGKWLAEAIGDAEKWGIALTSLGRVPQDRILAIEFPRDVADQFFRLPMLDGIGPARFATIGDLAHVLHVSEANP